MTTPNEEAADILDDAGDILENRGWIRGALVSDYGYCSVGAIRKAFFLKGLIDHFGGIMPELLRYLTFRALEKEAGCPDIPLWNDNRYRTKQEVLDTFRSAAKSLRG